MIVRVGSSCADVGRVPTVTPPMQSFFLSSGNRKVKMPGTYTRCRLHKEGMGPGRSWGALGQHKGMVREVIGEQMNRALPFAV